MNRLKKQNGWHYFMKYNKLTVYNKTTLARSTPSTCNTVDDTVHADLSLKAHVCLHSCTQCSAIYRMEDQYSHA